MKNREKGHLSRLREKFCSRSLFNVWMARLISHPQSHPPHFTSWIWTANLYSSGKIAYECIYIYMCTYFLCEEESVIKAQEINEWLRSHQKSYKTPCCPSKSLKPLRGTKNLSPGTSPENISSTATIIGAFNHQGLPGTGMRPLTLLWRGCKVTATKLNLPALRSWYHFHLNRCSKAPVEHLQKKVLLSFS